MKLPISDNFISPKSRLAYLLLLYPVLFFLSELYLVIIKIRHLLYDNNFLFFEAKKVNAYIISVGNISVGGTGKTPIVIEIAKNFKKQKMKCSVISRGYKRESEGLFVVSDGEKYISDSPKQSGDEPLLIARSTNVSVICSSDRFKASTYAIDNFQSKFIILDDGFQHRQLEKNLDIIVIDSSRFLGTEKTLPLGFLRDDISRLEKADRVIISKVFDNKKLEEQVEYLVKRFKIKKNNIYSSKLKTDSLSNYKSHSNISILEDKKIYAFCGLGNALDFFKTLENLKSTTNRNNIIRLELLGKQQFSDHYKYSTEDLKNIIKNADKLNSDYIVTTEKDFINFPKKFLEILPSNLYFLKVESEFYDNKAKNKIELNEILKMNNK